MSFEERTKTMLQHNNLYKKYTKKEMREILKSNLWGPYQRFELLSGMIDHIDVSCYAHISFKSYIMCACRELILAGFKPSDFELLLNPNFTEPQIDVLVLCIKHHIDISEIAYPCIYYNDMLKYYNSNK